MDRFLVILAACAVIAQGNASSLGCFVEHGSSATTKNMCEHAFHKFPVVNDVAACADSCVNDETCVMFAWELKLSGHMQGANQCRISSTCKEPTNALPGFQGYFRNSTAGKCAADASESWTRVFMKDAATKGAVCIDGSPG
jgi:hypothetical protein